MNRTPSHPNKTEAGKRVAWDAYKQLANQKILPVIILRPHGDAADELSFLLQTDPPKPTNP